MMSDDKPRRPKPGDADYVGYGHPPRRHRFTKENPSKYKGGRKRGLAKIGWRQHHTLRFERLILENMGIETPIRDANGRVTMVTLPEAAIRRLHALAHQGNVKALLAFLTYYREAESAVEQEKVAVTRAALAYKAMWEPEFIRCEEEGLPPPNVLPDPRDMIVDDPLGTVTTVGPMTPEQYEAVQQIVKMQDAILDMLQQFRADEKAAERRRGSDEAKPDYEEFSDPETPGFWLKKLEECHEALPPRLRKHK